MKHLTDTKAMLNENPSKLLFRLAFPTVLMQLITIIYNAADTFFVGKIDNQATGAVGVVFSLMALIQAIGFGIGIGSGNLISMEMGKGSKEKALEYANSAVLLAFVAGGMITLIGLVALEPLLNAVGATPTILPYAKEYATYIFISAPFMCTCFVFNSVLRSVGQAGLAMLGLMIGGLFNMFVDPLFIFTFDLGIKGAAICTMIGQLISFIVFFIIYSRKNAVLKLNLTKISRSPKTYFKILKVGSPTMFRQGMGSVATALLNAQAALVGDAAVAAVTIFSKVYMLLRSIVIGIGQGYQPIAGYNFGAGDNQRVRQTFKIATIWGTLLMSVIALLLFIFKDKVVLFFRDDTEVAKIAIPALVYSCISIPTLSYSTFVNQTYQCLGFSFWATVLASLRQGLLFIPVLYIVSAYSIITAVQVVQPIADVLTLIISIPFQIVFFKKHLPLRLPEPPDEINLA